jgi:hypothetical protein
VIFVSAFKEEKDEDMKGHAKMKAFIRDAHIVRRAADGAVSVGGKSAGKKDRGGEMFGQCIVAAMTEGGCMGIGTSYFSCAELYAQLTKAQVTH